jgi:peptide/nickel transport system permease protein
VSVVAGASPIGEARIARRETLAVLVRSKSFVVGVAITAFWVVCAVLGSHITPSDPLVQSVSILKSPSGSHLLGTDALGRDVLSRVLAGARDILKFAPAATLLAVVAGTSIGLTVGYFRGLLDDVVSRLIETLLSLPGIVLAVGIIVALGDSPLTLTLVVAFAFTPIIARTVRAAVLAERDLEYVKAAQLRAERAPYVMFVEILPNVVAPIVVEATVRLGYAIFAIAGLTFLGFGVQPPSPDWSLQIAENYGLLSAGTYWWTVLFPAVGIISLVVAVNLVADAISQVLER